jgi:hypothetical protein
VTGLKTTSEARQRLLADVVDRTDGADVLHDAMLLLDLADAGIRWRAARIAQRTATGPAFWAASRRAATALEDFNDTLERIEPTPVEEKS